MGMKVTRPPKKLTLNINGVLDAISSQVIGMIQRRTRAGKDINGNNFVAYSAGYRKALARAGESTRPDLWLTGGLMADVRETQRVVTAGRSTIYIGPGTGTSEARSLVAGKAKQTNRRGPAHNVVGKWLHEGTPHMPARPWLGLTPAQLELVKAKIRTLIIR